MNKIQIYHQKSIHVSLRESIKEGHGERFRPINKNGLSHRFQ